MANVYILNAHHYSPIAEGQLNRSLVELADTQLRAKGYETQVFHTDNTWKVEEELDKHQWADVLILQCPINWMMVPWTFKKYMDEVYSAGMNGQLCQGDGRHRRAPKENYGGGGTLTGKKYMLSLTANAPREAFDSPKEYLFQGKSIDDLWFPMHMNFRFFGMEPLPSFACYDVMKAAEPEKDFERYRRHLDTYFKRIGADN
jgi:modulator of drug activity B